MLKSRSSRYSCFFLSRALVDSESASRTGALLPTHRERESSSAVEKLWTYLPIVGVGVVALLVLLIVVGICLVWKEGRRRRRRRRRPRGDQNESKRTATATDLDDAETGGLKKKNLDHVRKRVEVVVEVEVESVDPLGGLWSALRGRCFEYRSCSSADWFRQDSSSHIALYVLYLKHGIDMFYIFLNCRAIFFSRKTKLFVSLLFL